MKKVTKSLIASAVAAAVAGSFGGAVQAKEIKLTASSSHPPIVPWVKTIQDLVVPEANKRLEKMGSPHRIKWTEAYAGALYNFQNTLEGIEQGLGDIGWVGTLWEPIKMPLHNVTYYAPFAAFDVVQLRDIATDMEKVPEVAAEWTKYNTKFLGTQVADSYQLMTKKPITKVEEIEGLKLITPGAISAMVRGTGAIPVDAGLPVFYNNMQTGVADGCIIITTGMLPFKLHEVAPYITRVNLGAVNSGALAMNMDTWKSLPKDVQEVFTGLGVDYSKTVAERVAAFEKVSFGKLPTLGAKLSEMSEDERKRWAAKLPNIAGEWAADLEKKGIPGKAIVAKFMEAVRARGGKPLRDWDKE